MKNNKILYRILGVSFVFIFFYIGWVALEYIEFQKVVQATGGMPTQDAGTVNLYQPTCVSTPPDGICKNCSMCGPKTGNYKCAAYSEIQLSAQNGTTEICPMQGFVYSGGGAMPTVGQGIIYGGASNLMPWVIGVPGASVGRTQKVIDFFKILIAGKKDK